MHVLGVNLPDRRLIKIALTAFHGVSHSTSRLICARLGFHDRLMVSDLTEPQINQLSALLSSPGSFMGQPPSPSSSSKSAEASSTASSSSSSSKSAEQLLREHNRLANLVIESDLRRQTRSDIAHHRTVGSYVGRRHAMGFPVRGQRTKTNASMAKRLNRGRVERRTFGTVAAATGSRTATRSISSIAYTQATSLLNSLKWRFKSLTV